MLMVELLVWLLTLALYQRLVQLSEKEFVISNVSDTSLRCCGYLSEISSSLRDFYIFSFFLYYNIDSKKIPLGGDVLDEEMLKILQTKTGNNVVIWLIS